MSSSGNTFEDIITKTVTLVYEIKNETLDDFVDDFKYENIFKHDPSFQKKILDLNGLVESSRGRINGFIDSQNHNLEYDDSGYSGNEKKINDIKIKYIREFLGTLDKTLGRLLELNNKIVTYIDNSSNDYANVSYNTGDKDTYDFVYECDMFILKSFDSFTIITHILNKFVNNFRHNKSITKGDFDKQKFYEVINDLTKRIYNNEDKNKSYNNVYAYLIKKIPEIKSKNPPVLNVKDSFFPFLEEIIKYVYDDKIALNFTEIVKCMDILLLSGPQNFIL